MSSPPPLESILTESPLSVPPTPAAAAAAAAVAHSHAAEQLDASESDSDSDSDNDSSSDEELQSSDDDAADADVDVAVQCLFCSAPLASMADFDAHTHQQHQGFQLNSYQRQHRLSFYRTIQLINYCRSQIKAGESANALVARLLSAAPPAACFDDQYLRPVLEDDTLLMNVDDLDDAADDKGDAEEKKEHSATASSAEVNGVATDTEQLEPDVEQLLLHNSQLQEQMAELQQTIEKMRLSMQRQLEGSSADPSSAVELTGADGQKQRKQQLRTAADVNYFDSYATSTIHEEMLRDRIRTEAYCDAIEKNTDYVRGKIVMDVGCGSGILSLFCARAGAKHVFAIEASNIASKARQIIADNQQQHCITVVQKRVEDVTDADVQLDGQPVKVDIIVSEWMGYMLLFESMLPSVLLARDRFMQLPAASAPSREQPLLFPNIARMYVAGASLAADRAKKRSFFKDCYGFNLSALVEEREMLHGDDLLDVQPSTLVTDSQQFKAFDLMSINSADLDFTAADVQLRVATSNSTGQLDALVIWFDTPFEAPQLTHSVNLSTSPHTGSTHWHQTVLYLHRPLELHADDVITLQLSFRRAGHNKRAYKVDVTYSSSKSNSKPFLQTYTLD